MSLPSSREERTPPQRQHADVMAEVEWRMQQLAFISDLPAETEQVVAPKNPAEPPPVEEAGPNPIEGGLSLEPLSESDFARAEALLKSSHKDKTVLVRRDSAELRVRDMATLGHGKWLNDEVINTYIRCIVDRNKALRATHGHLPRIHAFSTFFFTKLAKWQADDTYSYDYSRVSKWSRKAGVKLLECDKVLVPVHVNDDHWVLAVINIQDKRFEYYDPLGRVKVRAFQVLEKLAWYLTQEHEAYSPELPLDLNTWLRHVPSSSKGHMPRQTNTVDCGVFQLKLAECVAMGIPFAFTQDDMPHFRRRIALELDNAKNV